jgi:hypothetical protein
VKATDRDAPDAAATGIPARDSRDLDNQTAGAAATGTSAAFLPAPSTIER